MHQPATTADRTGVESVVAAVNVETAALRIEPLTPTIGAEISGVDLAGDLDDATIASIRKALLDHLVIFFRDQPIDVAALRRFAERFGPLHIHPTAPPVDGQPGIIRIHTDASSKVYAGRNWHSDVSCDPAPPMGSILHLHQLPSSGGDTLFASMYAAYDALSDPMKAFLEGLDAMHESAHNHRDYFGSRKNDTRDGEFPATSHPIVTRHPETGRKALFVNPTFTTRIVDVEPAESRALLEFLFAHVNQPRFHCRFTWRPNSVAFWDNRSAQHHALWDYYPQTRSGHRATIAGERPTR